MTCWRPVGEPSGKRKGVGDREGFLPEPACGGLAQLLSSRSFVAKRPKHQEEEALLANLVSLAPGSSG